MLDVDEQAVMVSDEAGKGLVAGRSKRSTAGNRMQALLDQQMNLEEDDMFREEENDVEFANIVEQEDVFDSDFGDSSDDEAKQAGPNGRPRGAEDDDDVGERELEEEEDRRRKALRKQTSSRMAPSVVRRPRPQPKARSPALLPGVGPSLEASTTDSPPAPTARRIAFALDDQGPSGQRRVSSRKATRQSALDTHVRLQEAEARRLQHPMVRNPPKQNKRPSLNQAELIELALEREEENRHSLREYLEGEEERKRQELGREKRPPPESWIRWRSVRSAVPKIEEVVAEQAGPDPPNHPDQAPDPPNHPDQAPDPLAHPDQAPDPPNHPDTAPANADVSFAESNGPSRGTPEESLGPDTQAADTTMSAVVDEEHQWPVAVDQDARGAAESTTSEQEAGHTDTTVGDISRVDGSNADVGAAATPPEATDSLATGAVAPRAEDPPPQPVSGDGEIATSSEQSGTSHTAGTRQVTASGELQGGKGSASSQPSNEGQDPSHQRPSSILQPTMTMDFTLDPVHQARQDAARVAAAKTEMGRHGEGRDEPADGADAEFQSRSFVSLHYSRELPPTWAEQWTALFGSHTDWTSTQIVPSRNRPLRPRASLCPITGKMARYRDSKTGVAFADVRAARVLAGLFAGAADWFELKASTQAPEQGPEAGSEHTTEGAHTASTGPDAVEAVEGPPKKAARQARSRDHLGRTDGFLTGLWIPSSETWRHLGVSSAAEPTAYESNPLKRRRSSTSKASSMGPPRKTVVRNGPGGARGVKGATRGDPKPGPGLATVEPLAATPPALPPHLRQLAIAPGDEKAVLAEALQIPEGTTRSGRARASLGGRGPSKGKE
ncbi:unnamed protein product [Parajaminaea phylloscopi]